MLLNKSKSKITDKAKAPVKQTVKVNKDVETEKASKNVHPEHNKLLHRQGSAKIKVFNQKHNPKDSKAKEVEKIVNEDINFETYYKKRDFKLKLRDKDIELINIMLEANLIIDNNAIVSEYNLKLSQSSISKYVSKLALPFLFNIKNYSLRKDVEELIKLKIIY